MISHLSAVEQRTLLAELNYLNLAEMRAFCDAHSIPYAIRIELASGERRRSKDLDRKSVVLARVRAYLKTGRVPKPTCFRAEIVRLDAPPKKLKPTDRLYYGRYDKTSKDMVDLLKRLTGGQFKSGAVARILCREFWTAGKAPTFAEFAAAWSKVAPSGLGIADGLHPEAAWLTDRAHGTAGKNWKAKRKAIAARVLRTLSTVHAPAR